MARSPPALHYFCNDTSAPFRPPRLRFLRVAAFLVGACRCGLGAIIWVALIFATR